MDEKVMVPRWGYRKNDGEVESQIFQCAEDETVPDGWCDSPAKVDEPVEPKPEPKRRGRPPKIRDEENGDD